MAAAKFKVVTVDLPQGYSTNDVVDIESPGFGTPAAVILFYNRSGASGVGESIANEVVSFYDGTDFVSYFSVQDDGRSTQTCRRRTTTSHPVYELQLLNASLVRRFEIVDLHTDGLSIKCTFGDYSSNPGGTITAIMFGGGVTAKVKTNYEQGANGNHTYTGVGFEPDIVFLSTNNVSGLNSYSAIHAPNFGVALNQAGTPQMCLSRANYADTSPSKAKGSINNNRITQQLANQNDTVVDHSTVVTGFNSDGFTTTQTSSGGTDMFGVLCLKFDDPVNMALLDVTIPASGNYTESSLGFKPDVGMIHTLVGATARNTMQRVGLTYTAHLFDSDTNISQGITNLDNQSTTSCKGFQYGTFSALKSDASGAEYYGTSPVFSSSGWTSTLSTNPSSAVLGFGLALGVPGAPSGTVVDTGSGSITYTGYAPTVNPSDDAVAETNVGAINYTGYTPNVLISDSVNVKTGSGTVTYTGYAPTVDISAMVVVEVPPGSIDYTGYAPTITITPPLSVSNAESTGVIESVTTTTTRNLSVLELAGTGLIDNLATSITHNMLLNNLDSTGFIDNLATSITHNMLLNNLDSTGFIDTVTSVPAGDLVVLDVDAVGSIESISTTISQTLDVQGLTSTGYIDSVTTTTMSTLTVLDATSTPNIDSVLVVVGQNLTLVDAESTSNIDDITISTGGDLVVGDVAATSSVDDVAVTKTANLIVADVDVAGYIEDVVITATKVLIVADATSTGAIDTTSIVATINLLVEDAVSIGVVDNIELVSILYKAVKELDVFSRIISIDVNVGR